MRCMVRIKTGEYLAIINEEKMVEIHASSLEEARQKAVERFGGDVVVCKIPSIIGYME